MFPWLPILLPSSSTGFSVHYKHTFTLTSPRKLNHLDFLCRMQWQFAFLMVLNLISSSLYVDNFLLLKHIAHLASGTSFSSTRLTPLSLDPLWTLPLLPDMSLCTECSKLSLSNLHFVPASNFKIILVNSKVLFKTAFKGQHDPAPLHFHSLVKLATYIHTCKTKMR